MIYEGTRVTLLHYPTKKDEKGFYHHHDMNHRYSTWRCVECSEKTYKYEIYTCWCGWNSKENTENNIYIVEEEFKFVKFSSCKNILNG